MVVVTEIFQPSQGSSSAGVVRHDNGTFDLWRDDEPINP